MKNTNILKKIVPLLREKEEVVLIPEKSRKDMYACIFACVFSVSVSLILLGLTISTSPFSEIIVPSITSGIFLIIFCLMVILPFNKFVVITNQRLIYFNLGKVISIERENIEDVTFDIMQRSIVRSTTVIETKDSPKYKIEFYDYKQIKEHLGL